MKTHLALGSAWLLGLCALGTSGCSSDGTGSPSDSGAGTTGQSAGAAGSGGSVSAGMGGSHGGGTSNTGASGATSSAGSGGSSTSVSCTTGNDACPVVNGLSAACEKRFGLGINYAWHNFAVDFGGLKQWSQSGVSVAPDAFAADLDTMKANGVSVVRWWMFPDFRGDGITFDASGDPSGISAEVAADLDKALELAEARNLYLVFTIFSFDAFRPDKTDSGVTVRSISPMVSDATRRAKLIQNVVTPVAHAAAQSAHASHLLGWDVINEPEWAIKATGMNGQDFSPNTDLTPVALADMKALIGESLAALKTETPKAQRSVGWAAAKWSWAFQDITDLEFNQPHIYAWVDAYWPYTQMPSQLGYPAKPTVYGEFFLTAMPFTDSTNTKDTAAFADILGTWYTNGFAGAWAWDLTTNSANVGLIKSFATAKGCSVQF